MEIKHKLTGKVIYKSEHKTIKKTLSQAVKDKINLRRADLWGADLRGANLWRANLQEADLNCIYYKTKVTKEQKELIVNSDLFIVEELKPKKEGK